MKRGAQKRQKQFKKQQNIANLPKTYAIFKPTTSFNGHRGRDTGFTLPTHSPRHTTKRSRALLAGGPGIFSYTTE